MGCKVLVGHFVTLWAIYNDHGLFAKIVINLNDQNKWEASSIQSNIEKSNEILASGILCWYRSKFVPSIIFDSIYATDLLALCDTLSRWRMHSMNSILMKQKKNSISIEVWSAIMKIAPTGKIALNFVYKTICLDITCTHHASMQHSINSYKIKWK